MVHCSLDEKVLGCPSGQAKNLDKIAKFLQKNNRLPHDCNNCFTIIISSIKETDKPRLINIIKRYDDPYVLNRPPYREIYFRIAWEKEKDKLVEELKIQLAEHDIDATVTWQKHCRGAEKQLVRFASRSKQNNIVREPSFP